MSDWAPVDQAAKDASGNFQVLTGGQWRPASKVAKNGQGKFVALLDDGAPQPAAPPAWQTDSTIPRPIGAPAPQVQPPREPSFKDRVVGAVETALDVASGTVGGLLGAWGGFAGGMGGSIANLANQTPMPEGGIERATSEGAERGATAARGALREMLGMGQQASPTGQAMTESASNWMGQNLPAIAAGPRGMVGATGAERGSSGVRPALRAVGDAARAGADVAAEAVTPKMSPSTLARVTTATEAGIPVSPHQLSSNKFLKLFGEFAENIPFAGGTSLRKTRREKFSGALAKVIDPATDVTLLDDTGFAKLQDAAGQRIGEIASQTDVPIESFGDMSTITSKAKPDAQGVIAAYAKDLATAAEQHGGVVPGSTLREVRTQVTSQARRVRSSDADLAYYLDNLAKRLDDALGEHAPEASMEALAEARRQYAVSKAIEPLVAAYPDGHFPPSRLKSVVTNTAAGKTRMAKGQAGELGEYARLGQEILKDQVSSGTAERNLVYGAAGGLGIGAGATVSLPGALAAWGSAGIYNLLGPRVVKALAERQTRRAAPPPERPFDPGTSQGFPERPAPPGEPSPLGDLTPDWETAPGAAERPPREVVPSDGLVPALGEEPPLPQGIPQRPGAQIPLADDRPLGDLIPDWETAPGAGVPAAAGEPIGGVVRSLDEPVPSTGTRKDLRTRDQIPAVPGRPDLPDAMTVGAPAEIGATEATGAAMQAPEAVLARQQQLAEVERVRAKAAEDPEVAKVLDEHAARIDREAKAADARAKQLATAGKLRRAAGYTTDPRIKQALFDRAKKLEGDEKVPAGETKEGQPALKVVDTGNIPVAEATEVPVEEVKPPNPDLVFEDGKGWVKRIPTGEATELPAEQVVYDAVGKALEVGKTYTDSKGRRAVWQANGTWKILR